MQAAVKKNRGQNKKTRSSNALAAAAAAERLGARKKSFFFLNFFCHLGHDADLIHAASRFSDFGLPVAPQVTFNLA